MEYTRIHGMLVKAPERMKKNKKGETVCKLVLFNSLEAVDKPLKAQGITAEEALSELCAGDTVETVCHETKRHYIIDVMLRKNNFEKGA